MSPKPKSNGKRPPKPKPPKPTAPPAEDHDSPDSQGIEFEDAFRECKIVFGRFEDAIECDYRAANMRLGEMAAKVKKKYGKNTLLELGKKLEPELAGKTWAWAFSKTGKVKGDGVAVARTLARNRSVHKAWPGAGKEAPALVSWAVLMELQGHPDRLELVTANPKMTKSEAREVMKKYKADKDKDDKDKSKDEDAKDDDADDDGKDEEKDDQDDEKDDQDDQDDEKDDQDDQDDKDQAYWNQQTRKWFRKLGVYANQGENVEAEYPKDPSLARKHITKQAVENAERGCWAWFRIRRRMKLDLQEAEAENLRAKAARDQATSNGNDKDPTESGDAMKSAFADMYPSDAADEQQAKEGTEADTTEPVVV